MLNFFDTLIEYIEIFVGYIVNFFASLANLIVVLLESVLLPQQLALLVPSFIGSSILAVLTISVTKLLLWGGNK